MKAIDERRFSFGDFVLDLKRGSLCGDEGEIELRPKSFELLRYLVENAGRLVPKEELIKAVWPSVIVTDESLAQCVSDVRFALRDRDQQILKTVPRRGYILDALVSDSVAFQSEAAQSASTGREPPERVGRKLHHAERRPLTIMACEFVGLAALSVQLDPEDLRVAM
ncbi:MAG TPA: transcriptional regulator, partial [Casimicrobiaceae bacterium]